MEVQHNDPMMAILDKIKPEKESDILGLGAIYGSSDEDNGEIDEEAPVIDAFNGLPAPDEIDPRELRPRRNRYRFPILPQMDLHSKRSALMNPQRRYHETFNRKAKRPRLADLLLADELSSERNTVLQCIRYLVNQRFFDESLQQQQTVAAQPLDGDCWRGGRTQSADEAVEEDAFFDNCSDTEPQNIDTVDWSDDEI